MKSWTAMAEIISAISFIFPMVIGFDCIAAGKLPADEVAMRGYDPVASVETCNEFRSEVDEIICGLTPVYFNEVGSLYDNFTQTSDHEVVSLLKKAYTAEQMKQNSHEGRA